MWLAHLAWDVATQASREFLWQCRADVATQARDLGR